MVYVTRSCALDALPVRWGGGRGLGGICKTRKFFLPRCVSCAVGGGGLGGTWYVWHVSSRVNCLFLPIIWCFAQSLAGGIKKSCRAHVGRRARVSRVHAMLLCRAKREKQNMRLLSKNARAFVSQVCFVCVRRPFWRMLLFFVHAL